MDFAPIPANRFAKLSEGHSLPVVSSHVWLSGRNSQLPNPVFIPLPGYWVRGSLVETLCNMILL